jgi:DNA segregation ATPase FtsK/SpoIIIE, S-DNA-T family
VTQSPAPEPDAAEGLIVRLRVRVGGSVNDVTVRTRPDASVADVTRQLTAEAETLTQSGTMTALGRQLPAEARWAHVVPPDGTTVTIGQAPSLPGARSSSFELAVVGGPYAGIRIPLPHGTSTVGRGSAASVRLPDPQFSREHLRLTIDKDGVTVQDAGSTNHTLLDGRLLTGAEFITNSALLTIGRSLVALRRAPTVLPPTRRATGSARRVIQRPPRTERHDEDRPRLVAPTAPAPSARRKIPWATILLPIVASGVLVAFTGRPMYILFALLSPLMALTNAVTDARSRRREQEQQTLLHTEAAQSFALQLSTAVSLDLSRRREAAPDLALIHAAATGPTALLWQRVAGDQDFLVVRVGSTVGEASVDVRDQRGTTLPAPPAPDVPVTLNLRTAGVIGLCGDAGPRDGQTRAILAQVLVLHSPQDVRLAILTSHARMSAWDWVKWVPHVWRDTSSSDASAEVALDENSAARVVARALADTAHTTVVVVDAVPELEGSPAVGRLLSEGPSTGVISILLAQRFSNLSRSCRATIDLDRCHQGAATVANATDEPPQTVRWDEFSLVLADELGQALAGWLDPDAALAGAPASAQGLPDHVGFLDVMANPDLAPSAVMARWHSPAGLVPLAMCGVGDEGSAVIVNLRSGLQGPNAFLAGTTGSGKSDFLRSFLTSLALANPPDALAMILIDFKEGSGLAAIADLPHVAALVTNEERVQLPRILTALTAEREQRQQHLKTVGYDNFDDYQAAVGTTSLMPRLLVVVDEFAEMRKMVPEAMSRLVEIVSRGRSAGMHLILATQTVTTAIGGAIADNTTLHICLRVENEAESRAVVGVPDAGRLPTQARGRGLVAYGQEVHRFQSGWLGQHTPDYNHQPLVLSSPLTLDVPIRPMVQNKNDAEHPTDLQRVKAALITAAELTGMARALPPWEPPLPLRLTLDDLPSTSAGDGAEPGIRLQLGLLDAPSQRARLPWVVDLDQSGHLVVVGGSRSGRSTLLRTSAFAASRVGDGQPPYIYVVEGSGRSLAGLSALPTVGAVVTADDSERLGRLLRLLQYEVAARHSARADASLGRVSEEPPAQSPSPILLLIDSYEALHDDSLDDDGTDILGALTGLLRDGPAVGLHAVIATDPSKVHTRLISSVGARLVLGLPDASQYSQAGVPRESVPMSELPPGRGIWTPTGQEVQVALLDLDSSSRGQNDAVARLGHELGTKPQILVRPRAFSVAPWAAEYHLADIVDRSAPFKGSAHAGDILLGVGGDGLTPVRLAVGTASPGILVLGPRASGRTQTLWTIGSQLCASTDGQLRVIVVAPRGGELVGLAGPSGLVELLDTVDSVTTLPELLDRQEPGVVVLVDDGDRLMDGPASIAMDAALTLAVERGHVFVVASTFVDMASQHRAWCTRLKRARNVVLLKPPSRSDIQLLGLTPPPRTAEPLSAAGRGLLFGDGDVTRLQVALSTHRKAGLDEVE